MSSVGWFEPRHPQPEFSAALACTWTARPTGRHRLVPDACLDLLCLLPGERWSGTASDLRLVLCGPERAAWTFELPAGTVAVGLRFRPGWASLAFDLDVSTLLDQRVPLEQIVGEEPAHGVRVLLAEPGTLNDRADRLEAAIAPFLHGVGPHDRGFVDHITDLLVRSPRLLQHELADEVGMTPRHLHRRLVRTFGYGASTLGRFLRFQRFLAVRELADGAPSIARLAAAAGYADQAHLARDCRAITGLTVRQFLDEWFPTFPDMSDPFKTAAPLGATIAG